jgi:Leucine Rich repeat
MTIDLKGCIGVSDVGLSALLEGASAIEKLNIRNCCKVTDQSAYVIGLLSPRLTTLDLRGCANITYASIYSVLHGCLMLTTVHLDYSYLVSDEQVSFLNSEFHAVNILFYVENKNEKQRSFSCTSDDDLCDPFNKSCDAFDTF